MRQSKNIEKLIKNINIETNAQTDDAVLNEVVKAFEESKKKISAKTQPSIWRMIMKSRMTKLAVAAAIVIAAIMSIHHLGGSSTSVAWAEVSDRFRSVPFFNATLYIKDDATTQPEQIELWMNQAGRSRLRIDNQVIFAQKGKITKAFDLKTKSETEPDPRAVSLAEMMGKAESFSIETVIRSFSDGKLVDVTPLVNNDAVISEDLVVFDVESENSSQWCRIWALQESKLPIRIRLWTPMNGGSVDVVLTYSKQQSDEFFDPQAFLKVLTDSQLDEVNLAYMFLEDPAQKKISPLIPDEQKAFEIVTQTTDGKPWSLGDYKGKAVLMTFWSGYIRSIEKYKEIYNKFGKRDDFIMVGVNLDPSVESVKTYCQKEGVNWLQLHESIKPWQDQNGMIIDEPDNKLAKALGITLPTVVLVKKDGSIIKIKSAILDDCVKALLSDMMFCPTQAWFTETICHKGTDNGDMTKNEIEQMFGKPDSIETAPNNSGQIWKYKAFLEEWSRIVLLTIYFDNTGRIVGVGNQT